MVKKKINKFSGVSFMEFLLVALILGVVAYFFYTQAKNFEFVKADEHDRQVSNEIFVNMKDIFYRDNGFYPMYFDSTTLTNFSPEFLSDHRGREISSPESSIQYTGINCDALTNKCSDFKITTQLLREEVYIRSTFE